MKGKGMTRLLEWGKSLLILLLAVSAVWLLGKTQFSSDMLGGVKTLFGQTAAVKGQGPVDQSGAQSVCPMTVAMTLESGQRYGTQYNTEEMNAAFDSVATLLSEALSSAETPTKIVESNWRRGLTGEGIYIDLYHPVSLAVLSEQLGEESRLEKLTDPARRICLSAGQDGQIDLLYINEEDGAFYSCGTTLSRAAHLSPLLDGRSPNGAMFAFEVPGMESAAPYTLLTAAPQPVKYSSSNPLASAEDRIVELLDTLSFQSRGSELTSSAGGIQVEGNDALRLQENGLLTFHTMGDSQFRFLLAEDSLGGALDYTQMLVSATVGKWCGQAELCLSGVWETEEGLEIRYQYCLDGIPVELPESNTAARFVIRSGAVMDFSLYFRAYTRTEETTPILPALQAAAILDAQAKRGNELILLYPDSGGETVTAGWVAR